MRFKNAWIHPLTPDLSPVGRGKCSHARHRAAGQRTAHPDAVCTNLRAIHHRHEERAFKCSCGVRRTSPRCSLPAASHVTLGKPRISFHEQAQVGSATLDAVRYAYELLKGDFCAMCRARLLKSPACIT